MNAQNNHLLIIQTALRPMSVVSLQGTTYDATPVADFTELFASLNEQNITSETTVFVNRGPGSYSGIRTGIAYVFGLMHAKLLPELQICSYTSFDLIRAATNHDGPIFLKAWPRVPTNQLTTSKGYFSASHTEEQISYKEWEQISDLPALLAVGEEEITTTISYRRLPELLSDPVSFRQLIERASHSNSLEPLYINPVHIT